ncbi:hypothetical protein SR870_09890 [Rhodopseudomonas palustris]|uniref:hypothetical protein n=1 Tax=Rhodopseudomonas palustris TaxID=1076 RepID=UPI002ACD6F9E|nr:hypothetical protein [Rhodopseudomonas palustris]WQH01553.1 hypothetical protein SR870_09890 [Rhodopseudomonas palustris]
MTILTADSSDLAGARRSALPLWIGVAVYAFLLVAGDRLLNDPDSLWQVTLGQWIIDHRTVPQTDVYSFTMAGQPWISTQWLSQVLLAASYQLAGWAGPVVLSAAALAATFMLYARWLGQRLRGSTTLVFVAAAVALMAPHMLARPHVLAMPVMVAWVGALMAAADRRAAPSFWLLPLMALWANLHGGFVLGIALVAPIALDAVLAAAPSRRLSLLLRWGAFGVAALIVSCANPYGWHAILASQRILSLGAALATIGEWAPVNFSRIGAFEVALLAGFGLALWRGVTLPPVRILLLLGLVHMALSANRNIEVLALLAPLIIAAPLARQIGGAEARGEGPARGSAAGSLGAVAAAIALTLGGTLAFASLHRFAPHPANSPAAAVTELKKLGVQRVFNDYDFGGYLIANGVAPFIDGRTELYGESFVVEQNAAVRLKPPEKLFRLLADYNIDATLLRTEDAATHLLDHIDGWQKVYSDDVATIHLRRPGAVHSVEPKVTPAK